MSDNMLKEFGRIASRPRWRASPRATLRCLGLSALIACAGCGFNTGETQPTTCRDDATGETFTVVKQEGRGPRTVALTDTGGGVHVYHGAFSLTCKPAALAKARGEAS